MSSRRVIDAGLRGCRVSRSSSSRSEEYARKIARDWNVRDSSGVGYVTRFGVRREFLDGYDVRQVGGRTILEYWIPAEDIDPLNDNIVGLIEVIEEHRDAEQSRCRSRPSAFTNAQPTALSHERCLRARLSPCGATSLPTHPGREPEMPSGGHSREETIGPSESVSTSSTSSPRLIPMTDGKRRSFSDTWTAPHP